MLTDVFRNYDNIEDVLMRLRDMVRAARAIEILESDDRYGGQLQREASNLWYAHTSGTYEIGEGAESEEEDGIPSQVPSGDPDMELCATCDETRANCGCEEFEPSGEFHEDDLMEVFEYWRVDGWAARRLEAEGETVAETAGPRVWCRTCTGQSTYMDFCWERLTRRSLAEDVRSTMRRWNWLRTRGVQPEPSLQAVFETALVNAACAVGADGIGPLAPDMDALQMRWKALEPKLVAAKLLDPEVGK
jgi:hypothetical protein